jgi:hypothetical protein
MSPFGGTGGLGQIALRGPIDTGESVNKSLQKASTLPAQWLRFEVYLVV